MVDLPTDVAVDDVERWKTEWVTIAESAGIDDKVDRDRLVHHLEKRAAGPGRRHQEQGRAFTLA